MFKLKMSFLRIRKHSAVFEDLCEDQTDLLLDDAVQACAESIPLCLICGRCRFFRCISRLFFQKCLCPVRMCLCLRILPQILPIHDRCGQDIHL